MKYTITDKRTGGGVEYVLQDEDSNFIWSAYNNHSVEQVAELLEKQTAPLHARIAELEAALKMNLDASSDVQWDEPIDAMRGRLQSIRAKSIHALKKAGDHD